MCVPRTKVNDSLTNYWLTNGTQQTEAFNNFKDELFGFNLTPRKNISWTTNYYYGQEHPDVIFYNGEVFNSPPPESNLPTLQGVPFAPITNPPIGHLDIFDSYLTWQATPKLTLALEGDYVVDRLYNNSAPSHADGTAGYVRYKLSPGFSIAGRSEYLSDRGGLFSGTTQALKESTLSALLPDGQFRNPEKRAKHRHHGCGLVVRRQERRLIRGARSSFPAEYTRSPGGIERVFLARNSAPVPCPKPEPAVITTVLAPVRQEHHKSLQSFETLDFQ